MLIEFVNQIKKLIRSEIEKIHTSTIGIVESYDPEKQTVSARPVVNYKINGSAIDSPIIVDCPLLFQQTEKTIIKFPIKKGDFVLLVFCESAIGGFLKSGKISAPETPERYGLSSAVAIPGIMPLNRKTPANGPDDALTIEHDSQKIVIKKNGDIDIGGESLKKLVNDEFKDLFNNHVHNYIDSVGVAVVPTPKTTSAPGKVSGIIPLPPNVPPYINMFLDGIESKHLTSKTKAE